MSYVETEEQQMLRKQVGDIGRKYGREYYNEKARNGLSPDELWDEVAKQGFIGVNTPEEYGGGGLGIYELAIVCEELAAAGCPLLLLLVSPAICATVIAKFGTDAQKERWLPRLASGELQVKQPPTRSIPPFRFTAATGCRKSTAWCRFGGWRAPYALRRSVVR
jgi:alkylation response protein AidB-like acyl-CoA dehydrogenase